MSTAPFKTIPNTRDEALTTVHNSITALENQRMELAGVYAGAEGGTLVEHEVGECITLVRKALVRLRKAQGELAQLSLPMEG